MRVIIQFSGGKDSEASLIWAVNEGGYLPEQLEAVFCDTQWEHELTYTHIKKVVEKLGVKLVTLKSKKYDGFMDLVRKKLRFPSSKARFCTEELKIKPMIDYILDEVKDHVLVIQGIRGDESEDRSKMQRECTYFKYYFTPYKYKKVAINKLRNFITGEKEFKLVPVYHTYRKSEVLKFKETFIDDIIRPVFDWTANQVLTYILKHGNKPNPLYYMGFSRVGCFPCIQVNKKELRVIIDKEPERLVLLRSYEKETKHSFFPPDYIPKEYCSMKSINKKGKVCFYPTIDDVIYYVKFGESVDMWEKKEDPNPKSCMSFYNICE